MIFRSKLRVPGCVIICTACAAGDGADRTYSVRDSAGIAIVENHAGAEEAAAVWRLSPEPLFSIGGLGGDTLQELHRVSSALREAGRIVIANAGTHEVRVYDETSGAFLWRSGRRGSGPGEFNRLSALHPLPGDSILVFDGGLNRVTILDGVGNPGRTHQLVPPPMNGTLLGILEDGTLLTSSELFSIPGDGLWAPQWLRIDAFGPDGIRLDSIARYSLGEWRSKDDLISPRTLAARASVSASRTGLWAGPGDAYEIEERDGTGALRRVVRWTGPERPVTGEYLETFVESHFDDDDPPDVRARWRERLTDAVAEEYPAYDAMTTDADGNVWVRRFRSPYLEEGQDTWDVFDPEGRRTARIELPRLLSFRLTDIATDHLVALEPDSMGVNRVRVYGLIKAAVQQP